MMKTIRLTITHHSGARVVLRAPEVDAVANTIRDTRTFYEGALLEWIYQRAGFGLRYVDVGAHLGNHALFFAVVCKAARVDAFEPFDLSRLFLSQNVELNDASNVMVHPCALGAETARGEMTLGDGQRLSDTRMCPIRNGHVRISTLDREIAEEAGLDILKVDVEDSAASVLRGGLGTIIRERPLIFAECATRDEWLAALELLKPLGYESTRVFNASPTILFKP